MGNIPEVNNTSCYLGNIPGSAEINWEIMAKLIGLQTIAALIDNDYSMKQLNISQLHRTNGQGRNCSLEYSLL